MDSVANVAYAPPMPKRAGSCSARPTKLRPRTPSSAPPETREPRGARRKRETRTRLLRAAFELFGARGADAVAINEITEAADVGFGSFYNHFESKDALYAGVVDAVFGEFADSLDEVTANLDDPAEVIAACIRYTLLRAQQDPSWSRFFVREGFNATAHTRGLGARLQRDIDRALAKKRIAPPDATMGLLMAGGTVLAAVAVQAGAAELGVVTARKRGIETKDLACRTAAAVLEALGIKRAEARKLASRPLPALEAKPPFA